MAYELFISEEAREQLRSPPEELRRHIGYRLHLLQREFTGDIKKLEGSRNHYRLRVGGYRILFRMDTNILRYMLLSRGRMLMSDRQEQELLSTVKHLAGELARLSERVEDLEDGRELDAAIRRNGDKPLIPWDQAKNELGLG